MADNFCVYIHTAPNGKRYVGITKQDVERRWRGGLGYKRNRHFFDAIVKYGWDNFSHEIYAKNLSQKVAENIEVELIAHYKANDRRYGYNHTDGGDGTKGFTPSEESRAKMSISRSGEKNFWYGKNIPEYAKKKMSESRKRLCENPETLVMMRRVNPNKKTVYQYSPEGTLIKVWESARQAEKELMPGARMEAVRKCCGGDCKSAYGYIWSYAPLSEFPEIQRQRKVYQYDKSLNLIKVWNSLSEAINYFRDNCKSTVINQCVSGHRPHAYGFVWSYSLLEREVS